MDMPSASAKNTILNHVAIYSAVTALMETCLNRLLFKEGVLKPARTRLTGKTMSIDLKELDKALTLVFSDNHVDVLSQWSEPADCTLRTSIFTLIKLKDKQQLSRLINQGDVVIEGDMQVVQHWSTLLDLAEWDPAHYLAPYIGDVVAEGISQFLRKGTALAAHLLSRQKTYVQETLIEEWKMAPGPLELMYFSSQVEQVSTELSQLEQRLKQLEEKHDTR